MPQPDLGFILYPLREFFRHQHRNVVAVLKQLAVLEVRFRRSYSRVEDIDWTRHFRTNINLFKGINKIPSQELADLLTDRDSIAFLTLSPQSIISNDARFQHMNSQWNRLCLAALEFLIAYSHLSLIVADICKVSSVRFAASSIS
jgi:hypothetical protein